MTKKEVIVAAMLLALPLGVRAQKINLDQGVNVQAIVAGFKKEAVASAKVQAVQISGPVSMNDQLDIFLHSNYAVAPSLDELKGTHQGKCYLGDDAFFAGNASITGKIIDQTPPLAPILELNYVGPSGASYKMHAVDSTDHYISEMTDPPTLKKSGVGMYTGLNIAKVENNLIAAFYIRLVSEPDSLTETGFFCVFPLSGAK